MDLIQKIMKLKFRSEYAGLSWCRHFAIRRYDYLIANPQKTVFFLQESEGYLTVKSHKKFMSDDEATQFWQAWDRDFPIIMLWVGDSGAVHVRISTKTLFQHHAYYKSIYGGPNQVYEDLLFTQDLKKEPDKPIRATYGEEAKAFSKFVREFLAETKAKAS